MGKAGRGGGGGGGRGGGIIGCEYYKYTVLSIRFQKWFSH